MELDPGVRGIIFDEFEDSFEVSFSGEGDGFVLLAVLPEFQGREGLYFDCGDLVSGGVAFGDDNIGVGLKDFCDFLIGWGELLAVSTPGGVELDEDVLVVFKDKFLKVLAYDDFDWFIIGFRDGL